MSGRIQPPTFERLAGLPPYGSDVKRFSATGQGLHSEGNVVRFESSDGVDWIGNFIGDATSLSFVMSHPDGHHCLVCSGGICYVVDPDTPDLTSSLDGWFYSVMEASTLGIVILDTGTGIVTIDRLGVFWESPRISWDGLRGLELEDSMLRGEAYDPMDDADQWVPFSLDLHTREITGGSYIDRSRLSLWQGIKRFITG